MTYQVKIIYPKEEAAEENKLTERTLNEYIDEMEEAQVIEQYERLLSRGYSINASFNPPEEDDKGAEQDPFTIANHFEMAGIPYKATLKLKAAGPYDEMLPIAKLIAAHGFDYDISIKLKVNETSPVDFEKSPTWFDNEAAKYTVLPKAKVEEIGELQSLYEQLAKMHYKVGITLKAKVKKDDDESFADQLTAYPEKTLIILKLSEADIYGEE